MSERWGHNSRALRALLAMGLVIGLGFMLVQKDRTAAEHQAQTVRALNNILWGMSELNFESQRLINALDGLSTGTIPLDIAQLRYDILWSRLEVARMGQFDQSTGIHAIIDEFEDLLIQYEDQMFPDGPDSLDILPQISGELADLTNRLRQSWAMNFGTQSPATRVISRLEIAKQFDATLVALMLFGLLAAYITGEMYFASRGQARERALRIEAARVSEAKSRFLANVSHEVRTPLNGILGMAEELADGDLSEDQKRCVEVIRQSGGLLLETINDVLECSKIEAGHMQIESAPFDLHAAIKDASQLFEGMARDKGVSLRVDIYPGVPERVLGDGRRLRQVLNNLIANAIKFTDRGRVDIRAMPTGGHDIYAIWVSDTGPGIPEDARDRIFEPFEQADPGVARQFGGTGLGLAISRQFCQAMGGTLTLDRVYSGGARFICEFPLPAAVEEASARPPGPSEIPDLTGRKILIADDNATNRLILSRFIAPSGAELHFARNGAEAIEASSEIAFDLVLMDVQMPRVDGLTAARAIRDRERDTGRRSVPIVAVTANHTCDGSSDYLAAGMQESLCKPVGKAALAQVFNRYLINRAAA